jgi:hypothetical protein
MCRVCVTSRVNGPAVAVSDSRKGAVGAGGRLLTLKGQLGGIKLDTHGSKVEGGGGSGGGCDEVVVVGEV